MENILFTKQCQPIALSVGLLTGGDWFRRALAFFSVGVVTVSRVGLSALG